LDVSSFRLRARLGFSIPAYFLRPARHYPRFWIWRPSSERQRDFNPHEQRAAQRTLRLLLTSCQLSPARSPRVRICTFEPGRQTLPRVSFGDGWISRFLARLSPTLGLTVCFCSCGRLFATPFFQLGLTASTLGFATLVVTACGYLLSDNEYTPMSGTLGRIVMRRMFRWLRRGTRNRPFKLRVGRSG